MNNISSDIIVFSELCDSGTPCRYGDLVNELHQQIKILKDQAQTDALTGLYNYRYFTEALSREMERSQRSFQPVCMILIDIDHFKKLNDQLGHEIGNQVLTHLADIIRKTIRKLDIPCRYGGEEFAVILPNTDLRHSIFVAQRIKETIEQSRLAISTNSISITASLGVDEYRLHHTDSAEGFVARVDALLYQAKHAGRNNVMHPSMTDVQLAHTNVTSDEKDALFNSFSYPESDK